MNSAYPVIGMSPGNSYFKDPEIRHLLEKTVREFGHAAILVADIPAIATYQALGYPENRARNKAVPKGNNLKNRTRRIQQELGLTDTQVRIVDWEEEIMSDPRYNAIYQKVHNLYISHSAFTAAVNATTRSVLEYSQREIPNIVEATKKGVYYLLSELAFLEFAPVFFQSTKVVYIYHKNWLVYEDYIAGKFDNQPKLYLDFLLSENPQETRRSATGQYKHPGSILPAIKERKTLRVGYFPYPPCFLVDDKTGEFSGIFHDVLKKIAYLQGWSITWSEEVGYGVIIDGLRERRFDIFGSTVWPTPERMKQTDFSQSLYDSPVCTWITKNKLPKLQDKNLHNDPYFRIAIKEDDISDSIAQKDFPNARYIRVPQLSSVTSLLDFVAEDKADATFVEPYLAGLHNKTLNDDLVPLPEYSPISTYANTFMIRKGENDLKQLLGEAIQTFLTDGTILSLIERYTGRKDTFQTRKGNV